METVRDRALAEDAIGLAWCRLYSDRVDDWLVHLFAGAVGEDSARVALVALGGYGRRELYPGSDLDVMLLHVNRAGIAAIADRVWYPIWDEGLKLGHSVRTVDQALSLARDDLDTATALLDARHLAGDETLSDALAEGARRQWERGAKRYLADLSARVEQRHEKNGEVAFLLEPDLKDGRGGLRDVHTMRWAVATKRLLFDPESEALTRAYSVLADARVALQQRTRSASTLLTLQEQDNVAHDVGRRDADELMGAVSGAARTIAWTSDDTWRRVRSSLRGPLGRLARRDRVLRPGVVLREGEIHVDEPAIATRPALAFQAAASAAAHDVLIERASLQALARLARPLGDPWPGEARHALVELLLAGHAAIGPIEALDQVGVWTRLLPEWEPIRSRPQRNAYHRFTVDRHLVEAAANAAELAGRVDRPDLLVVGTLLHDIGKGREGDHTEIGVELARDIATRMGFTDADVDTIVCMVALHLLLPDVATRRDLDDPATIERVAREVGTPTRLHLLAALTEADSLATGPAAWGAWKAGLVESLVERVEHVLGGGAAAEVAHEHELDEQARSLLDAKEVSIDVTPDRVTVVAPDQPGLFSRVTGVLTLHGARVLAATAVSSDDGWALEQFSIEPDPVRAVDANAIGADVARVLDEQTALDEQIERKIRTYRTHGAGSRATIAIEPWLRFDNDASAAATVIDVHAMDRIGVLYRITSALADVGLDIRSAKVETMGPHAVDAFYVRDRDGGKVESDDRRDAVEAAVLGALER